jgi:alpha-galactosidase
MDIDKDRLNVGAALCEKVAKTLGAKPKIQATMNRRKALEGADFVINMVQIGGMDSTLVDFEIPRKYGLNFTIADTTGPGGFFRALRTYPILKEMCQEMMEVCPDAVLLNYSNPMSMNMQTVCRTSNIKAVGLCHSVQGTFGELMRYIGEDPSQVAFLCAGINHMAFYLWMKKNGEDLYPRLWEAMKQPKIYGSNKVRFELMKMLGHYVTESSEHNAEYCPYFIPRGPEVIRQYGVPMDEYLRRCDGIIEEFERLKVFSKSEEPMPFHRSHEYGSGIIHSIVTGTPRVVYGNTQNNGAISNLPATAIVETPTLVDRAGLQLTRVGELPPQLIAYMMPHVQQHELFIRAAMEGRRDYVYQVAMFDPLTAATLTLDKIKEMCDELIAAHGDRLPKLDSKTLVPTSGKKFGVVDPKVLHASWDAAQAKGLEEYLLDWQVIGPFPGEKAGKISLDLKTEVEADFAQRKDGSVNLTAGYAVGDKKLKWKKIKANFRGIVDCAIHLGPQEWVVGYGYTEIKSIHARDCVLRCGSDDGIRIWLNGKLVHTHEVARGCNVEADKVPIHLEEGINRLLVKIDNYTAGWAFAVVVPKANF